MLQNVIFAHLNKTNVNKNYIFLVLISYYYLIPKNLHNKITRGPFVISKTHLS